ncbi:MAG: hypothetical protein NZ937_04670 [Armatimonadetes bacterium]|nr:hypothetical protein [Armatimonadota bacterium]
MRVLILILASCSVSLTIVAKIFEVEQRKVGVVCNIKVISDKVPDVSSLEAWQSSFIKSDMSDEEKALTVWRSVVMLRHQDSPPTEFIEGDGCVHDPIKVFNVYGYNMCCCASSNIAALARFIGLPARIWTIRAHVVPEVQWDGEWHMLDASLINYFRKPDGKIASVEEIITEVKAWYDAHPEYRDNEAKLRELQRQDGWTGWKRGPKLLANCPFYDQYGWLPAKTHGWYSTMLEYDGSVKFLYEPGYSLGYRVNNQLRPGERLVLNWFNKGLHVNMRDGNAPGCLNKQVGEGDLAYARDYGDVAPGRIGNGVREYNVPLADGTFRAGMLVAENLICKSETKAKSSPAVQVKDPTKPAILELRMPSSYVYLTGTLEFHPIVGKGGQIRVFFSDNNGLDWKEVVTVTETGERRVDLSLLVLRRYDYRLRFVLMGKGTGLERLKVSHDIQHSQRALPALGQGKNIVTVTVGAPEGTVTLQASTKIDWRGKNLVYTDFHPELEGIEPNLMRVEGSEGKATFTITTPGDMVRLRIGLHYRARDQRDGWDVQVSFDDGETFQTVHRLAGPTPGMCDYIVVDKIPSGIRKALVRFVGQQRNTTCLFSLRIDADYREPFGGFRPVKVTYIWEEGGLEKRQSLLVTKPPQTFTINCESEPTMKSLVLELQ